MGYEESAQLSGSPGEIGHGNGVEREVAGRYRKAEEPTLLERESLMGRKAYEVADSNRGGCDSYEEGQMGVEP